MEISEEQLAQIKAHLKVDGDDEDTLISAYASASIDYVERFCDGALVETLTPPVEGETQPREVMFTSGICAAMHLLIRSEEHTSELHSPLLISYAVCCLKKKKNK